MAKVYCSNCGAVVYTSDRVCYNCGYSPALRGKECINCHNSDDNGRCNFGRIDAFENAPACPGFEAIDLWSDGR